ncbi:hypothetical protein [Bacteroides mediterraneensis]|uniref:hypothetical protein n=1 Tax=Bacteroides mediterraneensis TaxID=1841856 RepID=UPI0026EA4660|nr:hypothetical protein [Bacteroides mediterraneensis]
MEIGVSEIVSIISSCVTVFMVVFYDRRIKRQQMTINDLQIKREQEKENDKKKANLLIIKHNGKIRIQNNGKCTATNIRAELQANNLIDSDASKLSRVSLEEGEFIDITTVFASQIPSGNCLNVRIQWDDDFMKNNMKDKDFI